MTSNTRFMTFKKFGKKFLCNFVTIKIAFILIGQQCFLSYMQNK